MMAMFSPLPQGDIKNAKVLIVDDDISNIKLVAAILRDHYEVSVATSGVQALNLAHTFGPDLILLDVVMPGASGYEVCQLLRQSPETATIPVIFITAQDGLNDELAGLNVGAVDFIRKPINQMILLARVRTHITLKRQSDYLRKIASIDGLTGVANRRELERNLDIVWQQSVRNHSSFSFLMIDVDYFKKFNDFYGHQHGDDCLIAVAGAIKSACHRPLDVVARYGGEEFCCLLPDTDQKGMRHVAESVTDAVAALQMEHAGVGPNAIVTVSIGAVSAIGAKSEPIDALVRTADQLLYKAKTEGRNRVCYSGGETGGGR